MRVLYYDCFSGISGDMNLGALIDVGVDRDYVLQELKKLPIGPHEVNICRDQRRGIAGTRVDVIEKDCEDHGETHEHEGVTFKEITQIIGGADLSEAVKAVSLDIFTKIAEAEGKVHGHAVEDVHFHEVGAVDSIVDIVGAAVCLDYLKIEKIISSPIQVGGGFVKCAHGILPVPAPATVEILRGIPIKSGLVPFETTTPTGAAILAATVDAFTEALQFIPDKVGYGIGQRDTDIPNVLRVMLGVLPHEGPGPGIESGEGVIVECNIDDMNPEHYGFIMELLLARGAMDVFFTPIVMKKSRPAVKISLLCDLAQQKALEEILWLHSSTFGLRSYRVAKSMLQREMVKVSTEYGEVSVKEGYLHGRKIRSKPEYEDCRRLAAEKGVSLKEIYDRVQSSEVIKR